MIPKIIHYCWFGPNSKPSYYYKCKKSWIKYFPGFEIIEWNEANTDLSHPFLREAIREKKWAFVSDFVRIQKLEEFGGIYLDTDMLFIKPFDLNLLKYSFFIGMEDSHYLNGAILGAKKSDEFIQMLYQYYISIVFIDLNKITIPVILNQVFINKYNKSPKPGLCNFGLILPFPVFYSLPFKLKEFHWRKFVIEETMAVHLWAGSWLANQKISFKEKLINILKYQISRIYVPNSLIQYSKSI